MCPFSTVWLNPSVCYSLIVSDFSGMCFRKNPCLPCNKSEGWDKTFTGVRTPKCPFRDGGGKRYFSSFQNFKVFIYLLLWAYLVAQLVKNLPAMWETWVCIGKIPWRRAWQPSRVFLPGESPWTEEPGGGAVDGVTKNWTQLSTYIFISRVQFFGQYFIMKRFSNIH